MKRLAAGALALAVLAGVTACGPSEEEKQRLGKCAQEYFDGHYRKISTEADLDQLNKEIEKACGVNMHYKMPSK
ncbi:hypothetical protein [Paenarthrobacter sp. NPDC057981]|uniref:hypothetical protein n=1 Tax=Paenarthrobacter sp. NPDC057981 TaxID=3346297 RepID=UPI0036DC044B